jgi:hypothetical protein
MFEWDKLLDVPANVLSHSPNNLLDMPDWQLCDMLFFRVLGLRDHVLSC